MQNINFKKPVSFRIKKFSASKQRELKLRKCDCHSSSVMFVNYITTYLFSPQTFLIILCAVDRDHCSKTVS